MTGQDNSCLNVEQLLKTNLLIKHIAGSHAYGTALPTSDVDIRGVFIANPINIRTPFFYVNEVQDTDQPDSKYYELNKFIKLAINCNPNIIETLWIDTADIIVKHPAWDLLTQAAPRLLNKKIAHTTVGYALSQLKRLKGHNKWINNPMPKQEPQQVDFVSMVQYFPRQDQSSMFPRDFRLRNFHKQWGLISYGKDVFGLYQNDNYVTFDIDSGLLIDSSNKQSRDKLGTPTFIVKFNRTEYEEAKLKWKQYWTWKKNRNDVRNELEQKYGYDTKNAMHLVRLMRMGKEALTEGVVRVKRPDAAELLDIRNGKWSYEEILQYAEQMHTEIETLVKTSKLPENVDLEFAAQLILDIQDIMWKK